jgi:hypothetical protein
MNLYESAKKAAFQVLDAHIRTKGLDFDFHTFTNAYKDLLDIAHDIGEKSEDAGKPINSENDCEIIEMETYDAIETLKEEVERAIKVGKLSVGEDNTLRGIADKLENICGSARAFIQKD